METTATATTAGTTGNRIEEFKSDVTDMKLKTGNAGRERGLMILGLLLLLAGVIGSFLSYVASRNYGDPRDIQTQIVFCGFFLTLSVFGAALFVRYSFAQFLRMWLLRQLYEGQANTDRLVDAIEERG
jgi:hypothetical protein